MAPRERLDAAGVAAEAGRTTEELDARATALRALTAARVPFLVAGAYAFFEYTGVFRDTKDLDLFVLERDVEPAFRALEAVGFRTELTDPAWIGKAFHGEYFVDLIFASGNGVAIVDDVWFENARPGVVMGVDVLLAPPEEIIWSKSFVVERERYDGADVNHILHACAPEMDWRRLLARFARYYEVLFSHVLLYRFAYPSERSRIPDWVIEELVARTLADVEAGDHPQAICRGNLLSRVQYQHDYDHHGYADGRLWDELERARRRPEVDTGGERGISPGGGG